MRGFVPWSAAVLVALMSASPALADPASDRAAIIARLQNWTAAFNARDATGVCDLFAPDLVSIVYGSPDNSRDALCARLARLLADPGVLVRYENPEIREIVVSGDVAIVLPVWTLTARKGGEEDVTTEVGIDVFRRQPDGRWSIARMASFGTRPNKVLD